MNQQYLRRHTPHTSYCIGNPTRQPARKAHTCVNYQIVFHFSTEKQKHNGDRPLLHQSTDSAAQKHRNASTIIPQQVQMNDSNTKLMLNTQAPTALNFSAAWHPWSLPSTKVPRQQPESIQTELKQWVSRINPSKHAQHWSCKTIHSRSHCFLIENDTDPHNWLVWCHQCDSPTKSRSCGKADKHNDFSLHLQLYPIQFDSTKLNKFSQNFNATTLPSNNISEANKPNGKSTTQIIRQYKFTIKLLGVLL